MSTRSNGEIQFCEGCPAQGNFLDSPSAATANLDVKGPVQADQSITHSYTRDTHYEVRMDFVDDSLGKTENVFHAVRATSDGRRESTKAEVQAASKAATNTITERIGRCASVGVHSDGKRYCPAFNSSVFSDLLRKFLDS